MLRLSAIFIVVCMVLISASFGAVLYLGFGLSGPESAIAALITLAGLALYNAVTTRLRDRSDLGGQIADLSRGTGDLARQVAELGRRTAALEGQAGKIIDGAAEKTRAATEAVTGELAELGTLVKQLAETVALHELRFAGAKDLSAPARRDSAPAKRDDPASAQAATATDEAAPAEA